MEVSFTERQRELCLLSSFIEEQEQWLNGLLARLGWGREELDTRVCISLNVDITSHTVGSSI